ncbi:hypothetical protein EVAR_22483_1 [Eumeta japonica]|uniref:Uncharacterized protein n=1 Tax=Eumeta variegata TaxID=151549 RepID=A0A4C1VBX0_EUMVA|nr:hypothetical protein EVAR_22483_1 [Eumeta japonica]
MINLKESVHQTASVSMLLFEVGAVCEWPRCYFEPSHVPGAGAEDASVTSDGRSNRPVKELLYRRCPHTVVLSPRYRSGI